MVFDMTTPIKTAPTYPVNTGRSPFQLVES
jgi:hypothetical protein